MKCARPGERTIEGGAYEDLMGGHICRPHTSQDKGIDGQNKYEEISQKEGRFTQKKLEGLFRFPP